MNNQICNGNDFFDDPFFAGDDIDIIIEKRCNQCKKPKSRDQFLRESSPPYKYLPLCKNCYGAINRKDLVKELEVKKRRMARLDRLHNIKKD